jgi:hypothetical protein
VQDVNKDCLTAVVRRYKTLGDVGTTLQVAAETVGVAARVLTKRCKIIAGLATTLWCCL